MANPVTYPLMRKSLADGIGTFALVFVGCGAAMVEARTGALGHTGVSLAFGGIVGTMIFATGHISGAHFNPAVTLAFAATRSFPWREVPAYLLAQAGAALLAALGLRFLVGTEASLGATTPQVGLSSAFGLEVVLTFFLMFVIRAVATDARVEGNVAGLAIGTTVGVAALMGGPLTGASMNPARSLGPALVSGQVESLWLYLLAPILGAVAGAWAYGVVCCDAPGQDASGCC